MKLIAYRLFGFIFFFFRVFPVKKGKIIFFKLHNTGEDDNFYYINQFMKDTHKNYHPVTLSKSGLVSLMCNPKLYYHLATAEYIFLNDNFMPLAYLSFSKKTKLIQLWHGVGAFKRFGLSTEQSKDVDRLIRKGNAKLTCQFISSPDIADFHSEAFGISKEKIIPTGLPVTDFYSNESAKELARERFYSAFPEAKGKKVLLFAPTFRQTDEESIAVLDRFNPEELMEKLPKDYLLMVHFHPKYAAIMTGRHSGYIDVSGYPDTRDLLVSCDTLITDYSSIVIEYSLLKKPVIFFAYDLESYDRGFYFDYSSSVPGPIVRDHKSLISAILTPDNTDRQYDAFIKMHFGSPSTADGHCTERLISYLEAL